MIYIFGFLELLKDFFTSHKSLEELSMIWDVKYNFPRPINEQHLSSYQAFLRLSQDVMKAIGFFVIFILNLILIYYLYSFLVIISSSYTASVLSFIFTILSINVFLIDVVRIRMQYNDILKRETKGSARWATTKHLKDKGLLADIDSDPAEKQLVPLVPFGLKYWLVLPVHQFAQHGIVLGPSGCGKTTTVFAHLARNFSKIGGLVALDISKEKTGEFYSLSAHYYSQVYRIDLMNPQYSDWFFLFEGCRRNPEFAAKIASTMIGEKAKNDNAVFDDAAEMMLKCIILQLFEMPDKYPFPSPSDIFDFLADFDSGVKEFNLSIDPQAINKLKIIMENSPFEAIRAEWKALISSVGDTSPRTYGSIIFNLLGKIQIFRDPKVQSVLRVPTEEEIQMGRRKIKIEKLRKFTNHPETGEMRGRALYIVVSEGEATRLKNVISTIMVTLKEKLKTSGISDDDKYVLFALDEAGNVPLPGLSEDFGVGRGRKMIFFLGFQGVSQLSKLYGQEVAKTIYENCGCFIIFPGSKDSTAEWASKMAGETTVINRTIVDAQNNAYDSERIQEDRRNLISPDEIRRMKKFAQCLVIIDDVHPIRARINTDAKLIDPRRAVPKQISIYPYKGKKEIIMSKYIDDMNIQTTNSQKNEILNIPAHKIPF
ncbi:MAG: type IV secretory system conjugative DNA transfer family protein [Endomicrobia bacterium]|nr:type IV secretory system conjugative DNA transfer family protein [Endomicrobiia bacterium]